MANVIVLTPLSEFFFSEDLPQNLIALGDAAQFDQVLVGTRSTAHTPFGPMWVAEVFFNEELLFAVPGLPVSLALGPVPGQPIKVRFLLSDEWILEIDNLSVALRFDPVVLRPVDPNESFAEVRVRTGLRITANSIELADPNLRLSLPLSEIPGTGITVALDGLKLDLDSSVSSAEILALGYDETFIGAYAESAIVRFFPGVKLGPTFGLSLEATNVAVSESGLTCSIHQEFLVDQSGNALGPDSEAAGELLSTEWAFALNTIDAELVDNRPVLFEAVGLSRVPILNGLCSISFGMKENTSQSGYDYVVSVRNGQNTFTSPFGAVNIGGILIEGELASDAVTLSGLVTDIRVDLDPVQLEADSVSVEFSHRAESDELRLLLTGVSLGPLGDLETLQLVFVDEHRRNGDVRQVFAEAVVAWDELRERIAVPDFFPLPSEGEQARIRLGWRDDQTTGQIKVDLLLTVELRELDRLFQFLPEDLRPSVESASLQLEVEYASAAQFAGSAGAQLAGALTIEVKFRLPPITSSAGSEIFQLQTGDESGLITARLFIQAGAGQEATLQMAIIDPISLAIQIPGLPQDEPPLKLALTSAEMELTAGAGGAGTDSAAEGTITIAGSFAIHPVAAPGDIPIAEHLDRLLRPLQVSGLVGQATTTLKFKDGRTQFDVSCEFTNANIKADLFDLFANLTRGASEPNSARQSNEVDLDLDIAFGLNDVRFRLGSIEDTQLNPSQFSFEIGVEASVGPVAGGGFLRLSDRELVVGIVDLEIPLRSPRFPLTMAELDDLRKRPGDANSPWTEDNLTAQLEAWERRLEELADATDTAGRRERGDIAAKKFLLDNISGIYLSLPAASNRKTFQDGVQLIVGTLEVSSGVFHVDTNLSLRIEESLFRIPFQDPRGITVEGGASLVGFAPDDPFKEALDGTSLRLGLSADQIYFSLQGTGQPIPIPEVWRYKKGHISFGQLTIGYGYTRNSLAIAFAGELKFPDNLKEDADTSRTLGFGIRLPQYNRLAFRLDLIPIPGPIPVVPIFEFNVDLRTPGLAGIAGTEVCTPQPDGLQLNIPNIIQQDFKAAAFSPLFGVFPIPNLRFDGDLQLGNPETGITIVLDDALFLAGLVAGGPPIPIPLAADPLAPYFENLCINLRLAGFKINFDLQRPFPSFNPLVLFEVLALIADPMRPVDSKGMLARSLSVTLKDARLTIPPVVRRLFPAANDVNNKTLNVEFNLGTLISAVQWCVKGSQMVLDEIDNAGQNFATGLRRLTSQPPKLDLGTVLGLLPAELRKLRTGASFVGFDGSVVLLLISPQDAGREFARRDISPAQPQVFRPQIGTATNATTLSTFRPNFSGERSGSRIHYPDLATNNLFRGAEFKDFTPADLAEIPQPTTPTAGIVIGARIRVFRDQRFRFLGCLFEDGSFALISALNIEPMSLNIAGITVNLPLKIDGRLVLKGRSKLDGGFAFVHAQGHGTWKVIPKVLRLEVGKKTPVVIEIDSRGKFALQGDASIRLFDNPKAVIAARIDVSETHLFAEGDLHYSVGRLGKAPFIDLALNLSGRIGPGLRFEFSGGGEMQIGGQPLSRLKGKISEKGAEVEALLDTDNWLLGQLPVVVFLELKGRIDLSRTANASFLLAAVGSLTAFGAKIEGSGAIEASAGLLSIAMEGKLYWQNREWLGGRLALQSDGRIQIQGRTSFKLDLTEDELPGGIQVASLVFAIDLSGGFTFNPAGGFASCDLDLEWALAVRLPGGGPRQTFNVATQKRRLHRSAALRLELVHIDSLGFLPLGNLKIRVPNGIITNSSITFRAVTVDAPVLDLIEIVLPEALVDAAPDDIFKTDRLFTSVPTSLNLRTTEKSLSSLLNNMFLHIYLAWVGQDLGIEIVSGQGANARSEFFAFRDMFPPP